MKTLLTGSRVYGAPRADSDIDLVVLPETHTDRHVITSGLMPYLSSRGSGDRNSPALEATFRVGDINIIVVATEQQFRVWDAGTKLLEHRKNREGAQTRPVAAMVFRTIERAVFGRDSNGEATKEQQATDAAWFSLLPREEKDIYLAAIYPEGSLAVHPSGGAPSGADVSWGTLDL